MMRFWLAATLGVATMGIVGCGSPGGSAIYAGAPDGRMRTHYTVKDGGRYTLFHVTQFSKDGEPMPSATQQVASYDLRPGEQLGFAWTTDKSKMYEPDAHANLEAYAGGHRITLGGIRSPDDRYYWADANGWNGYWNGQQARDIQKAVTLH